MKRTQFFENMRVYTRGLKYLDEYLTHITGIFAGPHSTIFEATLYDGSQWTFDTAEQFMAEHPISTATTYLRASLDHEVEIAYIVAPPDSATMISVRAPSRETIQKLFSIIRQYLYSPVVKRPPAADEHNDPPPTPTRKPKKFASPKTSRRDRKRPCRTSLRPPRPLR